jgi:hypothetical protein
MVSAAIGLNDGSRCHLSRREGFPGRWRIVFATKKKYFAKLQSESLPHIGYTVVRGVLGILPGTQYNEETSA